MNADRKLNQWGLAIISSLLCGAWAYGAGGNPTVMLSVCQDESTIERDVRAYMDQEYAIEARVIYVGEQEDDMVLVYSLSGEDVPTVDAFVDTLVSNRGDGGRVLERVLYIWTEYELPPAARTETVRRRIDDLNRGYQAQYWMPMRLYLKDNHRVLLGFYANIPGQEYPIPAEMAYDMLIRLQIAWKEYYPQLAQVLDATPGAAAKPAAGAESSERKFPWER
ncbi:MAG: hypothetical protein K9N49_06625 [Candidatus Marinimicrobia bacterium]|nr:hypothetical protein [Candidatus Neomarinimicrobiota bacterium]